MFVDFRRLDNGSIIKTDLCVVGAGAAGISIARQFIGAKPKVCLVESGGFEFDADIQSLYRGENVGLARVKLEACRLRFFGGTTNHWGGWSAPLNEIDFQQRSWVPYSGWPIAKSDLDPYYEKAQEICRIGPVIYGETLWRSIGMVPPLFNSDKIHVRFFRINPLRFGQVYREELEKAENIRVLLYANVTNIQTNSTASTVDYLDIRTLEGKTARIMAKVFILACGGIEIPRLLHLSNRVEPEGLGNRYDLVGRFFMDHLPMENPPPPVRCGFIATDDRKGISRLFRRHEHHGIKYLPSLRINEETQRKEQIANCTAWLSYNSSLASDSDATRVIHNKSKNNRTMEEFGEKILQVAKDLENETATTEIHYKKGKSQSIAHNIKHIDIVAQFEQVPNPSSRVTLSNERDALGLRRVRVDWNTTELDKRTVRVMCKIIAAEFGRLNLGRVRLEEWLLDAGPGWPSDLQGAYHHIGTTRMSENPKMGVVDKNCRVHGIENLYIASSSVFPTSSYVNPTLTIVALSLRLSEHLKISRRFE